MFQILLAGVLGIPTFILFVGIVPILGLLSLPSLYFLIYRSSSSKSNKDYKRPHQAIIVGGSSGIGFAIAKECVRRKVPIITLLARNEKKLNQAKKELEQLVAALPPNDKNPDENNIQIQIVSVDVTSYSALEETANNMNLKPDEHVVLWNCAGFAVPGEFLKVPVEKFQQQIQTNQLGTMYVIRAFLPHMVQGCIVLTSSGAGQVGIYGYSIYSPTKFAIQGLAQCLHAELIQTHPNVSIQIAFPVDTDTPGYHEEMKTTPDLTKIISESGGKVMSAERYVFLIVVVVFGSCRDQRLTWLYFFLLSLLIDDLLKKDGTFHGQGSLL